jgi:hypothetical protein
MSVKISEYKGSPIINILEEDELLGHKKVISFGKKKAKAILDHIDEIEEFVNNDNSETENAKDA